MEGLPGIHVLPPSGKLGVGPGSLRIEPALDNLVAINHGRFEAQGSLEGPSKHDALGWTVISRLARIGRGERARTVKVRRQYLSNVQAFANAAFGFNSGVRPGVYRLDLELRNRKGILLREFGEYFRAVEAKSELRLATNPASVSPGGQADIRVENLGTVSAAYGPGYELRNEQGELVPVPIVFSAILLRLKAGYASNCFPLKVPPSLAPGTYEIDVEAWDPFHRAPEVRSTIQVQP